MTLDQEGVTIAMDYCPGKLSSDMAGKILKAFEYAILTILTQPQLSISQISLLSAGDRMRIIEENEIASPAVSACLHAWIQRSAHEWPDCQAICAWDGNMSFSEVRFSRSSSPLA